MTLRPAGLLALAATAALTAGCGGTRTVVETVTATAHGETVFFAHITSLKAAGGAFKVQVDPAWWLTGVTAKRAALEDTGSGDVPNDYYIRDESHRTLTYLVPANARATVLVGGFHSVPIPVSELAQILAGKNPRHRRLFDRARGLGYWVHAYGDTVRSLEQQYQP